MVACISVTWSLFTTVSRAMNYLQMQHLVAAVNEVGSDVSAIKGALKSLERGLRESREESSDRDSGRGSAGTSDGADRKCQRSAGDSGA
jgi:hypothetical protein